MQPKFLFALLLLIIVACVPTLTPTDSGIYGNVTIGPTCPVMQINNPCPDKPYQATLSILTTDQRKITQFQTDANGSFRVNLTPGQYGLRPESPNVMPHAKDIPFIVKANEFTQVDVIYDSGIR